jgi:2-polyprenyl-3-methyl-5-hydroxy-6-metoxy-1,4-benzoquinol methylase
MNSITAAQNLEARTRHHLNAQQDDLVHKELPPEPPVPATPSRGGWLSRYARAKKLPFFFAHIPQDASILDVGCASGWVNTWAVARGWEGVVGLDLCPPADVVGDVREWKDLGLEPHSFDVIIAFEVIEHSDMAAALLDLLKPDGLLMVTTPVPRFDWLCKLLEGARILQPRVGPHSHLVDLREYDGFTVVDRRVKGVIAQWGILRPS